jgi:uncharacterized protein DUF3775
MLEMEPETVYLLILKSREFDEKDAPGESSDQDTSPADRQIDRAMDYFDGDPLAQEIKDAIDSLNEDHQAELVALTWLGRGDFTAGEWREALRTARERRTNPTSEYLLGTPLLGNYLEEGLAALGYSVEDLEPDTA